MQRKKNKTEEVQGGGGGGGERNKKNIAKVKTQGEKQRVGWRSGGVG